MNAATPWILPQDERPEARERLFCIPYAGGAAGVFRSWQEQIAPQIEVVSVELPGRGTRFAEPLRSDLMQLVGELRSGIDDWLDKPFALFGHSVGAAIAFELARIFEREGNGDLLRLFVSGQRALHLPDPHPPLHNLPDDELIEELRHLDGTPEELLADPELLELFLPILRADLTAGETYRFSAGEPLSVPISAFGGMQDEEVSPEEVNEWLIHTTAECRIRMFDGGHFFLNSALSEMLESIADDLAHATGTSDAP